MTRIICPECDASLGDAGTFETHMESEHSQRAASLGFGHTLG